MSDLRHNNLTDLFEDIADSIRYKSGGTDDLIADNFDLAIRNIPSGGGEITQNDVVDGYNNLTIITEPITLSGDTIKDYMFANGKGTNNIRFTPNIKKIGTYAFNSSDLSGDINLGNVEYVGNSAFSFTKISKFYAPNLKKLGSSAVGYNSKLVSISQEDIKNLNVLDNNCFSSSYFSSIELTNIKSIGSGVFNYCSDLVDVIFFQVFTPNIKTSGTRMFASCSKLKSSGYIKVHPLLVDEFKTLPRLSVSSDYDLVDRIVPYIVDSGYRYFGYKCNNISNITYGSIFTIDVYFVKAENETIQITPIYDNNLFGCDIEILDNIAHINFTSLVEGEDFETNVGFSLGDITESKTILCNPNNNIVVDTESNFGYDVYKFNLDDDGYYVSSNNGKNNSCSYCKLYTYGAERNIELSCISYGESAFDYGIISNIDTEFFKNYVVDASDNIFKSFKYETSATPQTISIPIPQGEHFITIKYVKNGSYNAFDDNFKFKVISQ